MKRDRLRKLVSNAMANAKANGHTFEGVSHLDIAHDIKRYDAELEDERADVIAVAVLEWQNAQKLERNLDATVPDKLRRIIALCENPHWDVSRRWRIRDLAASAIEMLAQK